MVSPLLHAVFRWSFRAIRDVMGDEGAHLRKVVAHRPIQAVRRHASVEEIIRSPGAGEIHRLRAGPGSKDYEGWGDRPPKKQRAWLSRFMPLTFPRFVVSGSYTSGLFHQTIDSVDGRCPSLSILLYPSHC